MFQALFKSQLISAALFGVLVFSMAARADTVEAKYHKAFYLEQSEQDMAEAARLYADVIASGGIDEALLQQAKTRLAVCQEEIACADLAKLMPPDTFAYVELNRPSKHLAKLLDKLGILANRDAAARGDAPRVAVSPALLDAIDLRGLAMAVTDFDLQVGEPTGVLILHPGDVQALRGVIESGLPIDGERVEPIGGFPTYFVKNEEYVTLTHRLLILSPKKELVRDVVRRLSGEETASLMTNERVADLMTDRDDALISFFIDAAPIMPKVKGLLEAEAAHDPEVAMVLAMLDVDSLRSLSGRIGVGDAGLFAGVELRLKEGHHNLVYNFFRTPPIAAEALDSIPHGAAAFVVGALNPRATLQATDKPQGGDEVQVVTALDFGRELFGNIATVALYGLPPEDSKGTATVPDLAAAISVNDPSKSEALWTQILGIAGMAAGAPTTVGEALSIAGVTVRTYRLGDKATLHFATVEDTVLVASTRSAMARSIAAQRGGKTIRQDAAFTDSMSRIGEKSTKAVFVHPGRCLQMASPFMSQSERDEVRPFLGLLTDAVASLVVEHSGESLRVSAELGGIPKVGKLLSDLIAREQEKGRRHSELQHAISAERWEDALAMVDAMLAEHPNSTNLLGKKFHILAVGLDDDAAAKDCAAALLERAYDQATVLNNFAWKLLTEDPYEGRFNKIALDLSERSNAVAADNWMFLDTLALARFVNGDAELAIAHEERAIALADNKRDIKELESALERYKGQAD